MTAGTVLGCTGLVQPSSSLGLCPLHCLCPEPAPLMSQGPHAAGQEGRGCPWGLAKTSPLPAVLPHPHTCPTVSQLSYTPTPTTNYFSIEFIYSFNKHSQNPICQEAMLRFHSPQENPRTGEQGTGHRPRVKRGSGGLGGFLAKSRVLLGPGVVSSAEGRLASKAFPEVMTTVQSLGSLI